MLALFLLFIVGPVVELFLLVRIGRLVGVAPVVGFLVAMGLLGAIMAKSKGRKVIRQWQAASAQGQVPEEGVLGGVLILFGALLLILPGILSDVLGLLLVIPALRRQVIATLGTHLARKMTRGEVRVYGPDVGKTRPSTPTSVGRASYRPGEVIDTQGEEVE